jgi:hypothetical protein
MGLKDFLAAECLERERFLEGHEKEQVILKNQRSRINLERRENIMRS